MAETFDVTAAIASQRLNGTEIVDVMEVTAITKPHGISITVTVTKAPGWKEVAQAQLAAEAEDVESVFDL